ncbi:phosphohydrolase [Paenibacillus sp. BIHB 4019]|uniref:Phosphohydrolase n=1 Tax=Paenibacillus sp. BIHB 4019 TaxID=1870819 RepID=A0A1B2DCX2_9BACL|nr:HD domain-containing protein [Paenibacillus sp. BIHB 4019]ANY65556.1 phosphohydrolase [Paenibacillus sp. BIHB 4019]
MNPKDNQEKHKEDHQEQQANESILLAAEQFVRQALEREYTGHDWQHIRRVTQTAKAIAREEQANLFICELAALLHDIADAKLNASEAAGLQKVRSWLEHNNVHPQHAAHVMEIISTMSFKGGGGKPMSTLEGEIVQDADRLDAIGAIGIARTFAYAGAKGHLLHDPNVRPRTEMTEAEYRSGESTAVHHFYEKLLKLKDLMNTAYGKKLAETRHQFMLAYLEQFYAEWDSEC